jgi:hypothetical protein
MEISRNHLALRLCSKPSAVLGPVEAPPCIQQRPFFIAAPPDAAPRGAAWALGMRPYPNEKALKFDQSRWNGNKFFNRVRRP